MTKPMFRVLVEAHDVRIQVDDRVRRSGFLQTFWVEADHPGAAAMQALKAAAGDPQLREQILNERDAPPWFSVYELERVAPEEMAEVEANPTGRAFYPETVWSPVVRWWRRIRGRVYVPSWH